jgi:hypothetical protein
MMKDGRKMVRAALGNKGIETHMKQWHNGLQHLVICIASRPRSKPFPRDIHCGHILEPGPKIVIPSVVPDLGEDIEPRLCAYFQDAIFYYSADELLHATGSTGKTLRLKRGFDAVEKRLSPALGWRGGKIGLR